MQIVKKEHFNTVFEKLISTKLQEPHRCKKLSFFQELERRVSKICLYRR